MLSEAQLAVRRRGIGASEIAAVVGLDPYKSRADVWAAKCLDVGHDSQSEPAEWGNRLEPAIVQAYSEKVHPSDPWPRGTVFADALPFALATPDATHTDEPVVVQAKCSSLRMRDEWGPTGSDGVLDQYNCQLQWEMFVLGPGWERAALAVLIGGNEFRHYLVRRDARLVAELVRAAESFWWQFVETRTPPPIDATTSTETLLAIYPTQTTGKVVPWTPQSLALATEYAEHGRAERAAKELKEDAAARLKAAIGDAEAIGDTGKGAKRATWKTQATAPAWSKVIAEAGVPQSIVDKHKGQTRVLRVSGFATEE